MWLPHNSRIQHDSATCDACLRGNAPKCGPSGHLPTDEGLWFLDIWHCNVPSLWKRERTVIGFTNAKSRLFRSFRVKRKSQAPEAYELVIAFANSLGLRFTWLHADQAWELVGTQISTIAKKHGFRITTSCVGVSRQNPQEPQWRAHMAVVRVIIAQARLPLDFWEALPSSR